METALLIILAGLVVLLSALLVVRLRREARDLTPLDDAALARFGELIKAAILEGDIQAAAIHVSHLLRVHCGCNRILFLRRRGHWLELSYHYGLGSLSRRTIQVRNTLGLMEVLRAHPLPDAVDRLRDHLPRKFMDALEGWACDLYFPIFWRDHLYGLYFVSSTRKIESPAFRLVVASMAQTLSASYHVKWHEEKHNRLQEQIGALEVSRGKSQPDGVTTSAGILKLVRHRDSETLVGHIVDEVRKDLKFERSAFFYSHKNPNEPVSLHDDGSHLQIEPPSRALFERLVARLDPDSPQDLSSIGNTDDALAPLERGLRDAGMSFVTPFRLSARHAGILAWGDKRPPAEITARLRYHRLTAAELMANAESFEEVESLSYTDSLTGLANQRYFLRRLDQEIDRAKRYGRSLGLIIFDLDDLKGVNDRYGHQAGDQVLRQMGELLRKSIRSIDVVARYGGDEFCIIMPESDKATCAQFMTRLQQRIAGWQFSLEQVAREVTCTISLGGAIFPQNGETPDQLIYAADMALLKAKEAGRNRSQVC